MNDVGLVVAVGGDGTVSEVVQGLAGSECPLGIIPAGTANILATELGIPMNPVLAVEALLSGEVRAMDLFRVNGRLGAMVTSSGLDAGITRWMARQRRGHIGYLNYLEGIWLEIGRYPRHQLELTVDGRSLGAFYEVIITNTRNYGGVFRLKPEACLDDGLLDICAFSGQGLYRAYKHFTALAFGLHLMLSDVWSGWGSRIEVATQDAPYQVDGDFAGTGSLLVEVVPRGLRVVVPRPSMFARLTARRKGLWSP